MPYETDDFGGVMLAPSKPSRQADDFGGLLIDEPEQGNFPPDAKLEVPADYHLERQMVEAAPTILGESAQAAREGKLNLVPAVIRGAQSDPMYQSVRRSLGRLFGVSEADKIAESVPVTQPDGSTAYEYKPQANEIEKRGLLPALIAAGSAVVDAPTEINLQLQGKGSTLTDIDAERQRQMFEPNANDSSTVATAKAAHNAVLNLAHTVANPVFVKGFDSRVVSGAFAADMTHGTWEQIKQAAQAPTLQGKIEGWVGAVLSALFAAGAAKHAAVGHALPPAKVAATIPDQDLHRIATNPAIRNELPREALNVFDTESARRNLPKTTESPESRLPTADEIELERERLRIQSEAVAKRSVAAEVLRRAADEADAAGAPATAQAARAQAITIESAEPAPKPVETEPKAETPAQDNAALLKRIADLEAKLSEPTPNVETPAKPPAEKVEATQQEPSAGDAAASVETPAVDGSGVASKIETPDTSTLKSDAKDWEKQNTGRRDNSPNLTPLPESAKIPVGTVIRSKTYDSEGDIIIQSEPHVINGMIHYEASFPGTGRYGGIAAKHIDEIVSPPNPKTPEPPSAPVAEPLSVATQKQEPAPVTLATTEAAPEPVTSAAKPSPSELEKLHVDAYGIADTIADSVARGQPDSVREAARDAAHRNAVSSIESTGGFNPDYMRKSAMSAAGKEAKKLGTSLDEPLAADSEATGHDVIASSDAGPVEHAQASSVKELVDGEMAKLPETERRIIEQTADGVDDAVIAEDLGIAQTSVVSLRSKARKTLAEKLVDLLDHAIDATKREPGTLFVDPFLIQTVGRPALRLALQAMRAAIESGASVIDAVEAAIISMRNSVGARWNADIEAKAREFLAPVAEAERPPSKPPAEPVKTEASPKASDAVPPKSLEEPPSSDEPQGKIGGYNADVEARQKARGQTPTISEARKEDPVTWQNAMDEIARNPTAPEALVERIHRDPKTPITDEEQQMLTWQRATLEDRMTLEAERAIDPTLSPQEQAAHQTNAELYEAQLLRTEQANRIAGTAAGRTLRSRQLEMNEDYTFAGLMMRRRKLTGEVVPPETAAEIKVQAAEIAAAKVKVAELEVAVAAAKLEASKVSVLESTIAELRNAGRPEYGKEVFTAAHRIVDRWKKEADEARTEWRKQFGHASAIPVPTKAVVFVAKMIRAKIGEFGLNFAETKMALIAELGPEIEAYFQRAWVRAQQMISNEGMTQKVRKKVEEGVDKPIKSEKTPQDIAARAKAEASVGMELGNRTAYEAVRAVINYGVKGELEIMQAAHDLLTPSYPDLTLNELDVKFTDYGNAKYPSTEANKVALAKQRRLRQMQAAIDDVKRRGETAKSGVQRAKSDADIRKREAELKAAIEEFGKEVPTSPEQLANRERARLTAAENAIKDLDLELKTGEAKIKAEPKMPSAELEQLQSELAAMRELKKEIADAKNPPLSEAQKALDAALVARERAAQTLDDISTGTTKPATLTKEALTQLEEDIRLETDAMKALAAEMRRDAKPKADPGYAKEQAQIAALEKAIERYQQKTAANDFTTKGKTQGPDSRRVAALKEIRDSRRSMYETARKANKPVLSPEERYNQTRAKNIAHQIADAEARLKSGNFAPRPKKVPPALTKANLDAKAELEAKKNEVRQGEERYRLEHRTQAEKAKERALLLLQSVRGIVLGSDIGVLTRQGLFAWARPATAIKATATAFKAAMSPASMARWEIEVRDRKINGVEAAPIRKEAGLQITDTVTHPEELVITRLLSRIPDFNVGGRTIKLSAAGQTLERFQTTFINAVRADLFDSAIKQGFSPEELKLRANFINSATGRGNIKHVPKAMSVIFTSPRYESSRWETLAQPVRNIGALARDGVKGELNKAALSNLKDMAVTLAGIYTLYKVAEVGGYSVNWNPQSSDFLKMRKGEDVWDVSAGLAPRLRDLMRIYVAITHPSYSENIGKVMLGSLLRTINPAIKTPIDQGGVAVQRLRGEDDPKLPFSGFRSDEEREGWITLAPLIVQSTQQALNEDGFGQAAFSAAREFVGSSVNRYPEPSESTRNSTIKLHRDR